LADTFVDVREESVGEAVPLGEGLVLLGRIEGDPEDDRIGFLELRGSVTEPLPFERSAGGIGLHVPPQDHPPAAQVGERHGCPVLIGEREVGGRDSLCQHGPGSLR
jgi:hypothetical protein